MSQFKSFIGIPGGSETEKCFYPFKLDTYGRGCSSNCVYCYARATLDFRKLWDDKNPAQASIEDIGTVIVESLLGKRRGKIPDLLRARVPLRLGGNTDCFAATEREHGISLWLLGMLSSFDYPYLILTKNALIAEDAYLQALRQDLAYIQFSISTVDDAQARVFEPGADPPSSRLEAMKRLSDEGYKVTGRICPLIPNYLDGYHSRGLIVKDQPLNYFSWDIVDQLADAGCQTVIAGFLRLNYYNNNRRRIIREIGLDLDYLFDPEIRRKNDALYFSIDEKRYYYERLRDLAHAKGMRFSVCYDGDESYDVFQYLWDNPSDCCDWGIRSNIIKEFYPDDRNS